MLVGYRFVIAALCIAVLALITKRSFTRHLGKGVLLGICLFLIYAPQTIGLKFTTASNSAFITGLFVMFVPLFAWMVFRVKAGHQKVAAVIVAGIGLWLLTGGLTDVNAGDVMTLITAAAYGMHIVLGDRYMKSGCDPYMLTFQQFSVTGILSILGAVIIGDSFNIDIRTTGIIIFLALLPTLSAFLIQMIVQKFENPVKVAIIFSLEPVFAAIFAWTLGGESFIPLRALGGAVIVSAMILAEVPLTKRGVERD